jgi:hypothetical protein
MVETPERLFLLKIRVAAAREGVMGRERGKDQEHGQYPAPVPGFLHFRQSTHRG